VYQCPISSYRRDEYAAVDRGLLFCAGECEDGACDQECPARLARFAAWRRQRYAALAQCRKEHGMLQHWRATHPAPYTRLILPPATECPWCGGRLAKGLCLHCRHHLLDLKRYEREHEEGEHALL